MTPTDAQLAAEFARDAGLVLLAILAAWAITSTAWFLASLIRSGWRPMPLRYWLTGKADR